MIVSCLPGRNRRGQIHHARLAVLRDGGTWTWHGPTPITQIDGVSGKHVVLQSTSGNIELGAPLAAGGLDHWWRDNPDQQLSWHADAWRAPRRGPAPQLLSVLRSQSEPTQPPRFLRHHMPYGMH